MKKLSPFGSVPVRIAGSSGNRASRFGAAACGAATCAAAGATTSSTIKTRYAARMRLKIRRLDATVPLPAYGTDESAGFDLAASQDATIKPGQIALIRTGLVIEVPIGHFLGIFARSST